MSRKVATFPWILLLIVSFVSAAAFGQTTASIKGTVTDSSGAAVAGAQVTVKNPDLGIERTTQSNSAGDYEVPALPPGKYSVQVGSKGFETKLAKGVLLQVSQNSVQNFSLKVASTSEVVTVEATAPSIETTTVTVGEVISQKTVQEIPLNGRHFVDLGLLVPGSVTPPQNGFLTAPLRGQGSFAFNTAGNREDTVNFMVNGINLNDMVQNQITFQPSINTVSEFKVDNSTYSAEYGRNSGAIVNIATRSGTNSYHGEVFEFIRNEAFDARNFFNRREVTQTIAGVPTLVASPQSTFKRNNFGANFGGPIVKDKTFFFLSYEGTRQRQGILFNTQVLDDTQRASVLAANNPTSVKLLSLIPAANSGTNTFTGAGTAPVDIDQGTADISHTFSGSLSLHGYYALQHDLRQEPNLQGNTLPGFGDTRESKRQIMTVNLTKTISSSMVNEARLGFNRIHITFSPNATQNPADFGIADGINFAGGLPQISIGQTQINLGGPAGFPQGRGDTTVALGDALTYVRGRHSFKFGAEARRFLNNNFNGDAGALGFTTVQQFIAGTPSSFSISPGNNPSRIAVNNLGFYGQDSWKVLQRLTLELGLRYDWNGTPSEAQDRFVNAAILGPGQLALVRTDSPYQQNAMNFQPRFGFAYDVFGNGRTIVRSGYAILTDQPITNLVTPLTNNPPLGSPKAFNGPGTTTYANLLTAAASNGLAPTVVDPDFQNSYIESYNVNVQHQLSNNWSMMVGYFGSEGRHLRTRVNLNQITGFTFTPTSRTAVRPFQTISASSPIDPGLAVGNISDNVSNGNSSYNALWISSDMRAWHGLQFNASYTFSKSLDYTSQNGQGVIVQNSFNPAGDRGLSDFDARHRFVMNFIYSLPFKGNRFLEGWQVGSILSDQSGNPVNILASSTLTNIAGAFAGLATIRPDQLGTPQIVNKVVGGTSPNIQYFVAPVCDPAIPAAACTSTSVFAIPDSATLGPDGKPLFHFGSTGRNSIIGPGFNNVDFSLIKRTKINERFSNELRFEAFDLFNHPNFGQPNRTAVLATVGGQLVTNPSFGQITNTRFGIGDSGSARQLQFAMKLVF